MQNIPSIGFGTYRLRGDIAYESTLFALKNGYTHIDTATLYGNEEEVGKAIKDSGIKRENLFITTKILLKDIEKGESGIVESIQNSLNKLKVEYLDLVLFHAPPETDEMVVSSWKVVEKNINHQEGGLNNKVKRVGVSNYNINHLKLIFDNCTLKPYCNQIELSPYLQRKELVQFCRDNQIIVVAHSSLVKGEKFNTSKRKDEKLHQLSIQTGICEAHLLLCWAISKNYVILPRSSKNEHITENLECLNINVSDNVINTLDTFDEGYSTHPKYLK